MEQYGLGVILYSFLNKEELDSPYYAISKYLLENMDRIKNYSIAELAKACNVSIATVSRFCRKVGLDNFFDLKMVLYNNSMMTKPEYGFRAFSEGDESLYSSYLHSVIEHIRILEAGIDFSLIDALVDDIYQYHNVSAFGAMHMENTALNLQNDLFRCRKIVNTRLTLPTQIELIGQSDESDLILIFTLSGKYIKESLLRAFHWEKDKKPKIYVITGNKSLNELDYIDTVIALPFSNNDFAAHPHGMNLVCSLISLKYFDKYVKNQL